MHQHSVPTLISLSLHVLILTVIGTMTVRNIRDARSIVRVTLLEPAGGGSKGGSPPAASQPPAPAPAPVRVAPPPPPPPKPVQAAVRPRPVPAKKPQPKPVVPPPPQVAAAPPVEAPPAAAPPVDGLSSTGNGAASGAGSGQGSGSGTGRGNGTGPGRGTGKGTIMGAYLGDLRERIERAKHYPPLARRRGVEGRVAVAFEITRSGQVRELRLAGGSHPLLDQAALLAVETAAPFPHLPPEAGTDALRVEVALRFTLEDQR